ncbi:MAG: ribose-5-phosphate isomerase RpiA [Thermoplasmata archaeon]|nr:MAG: ribose-5-phosphate isomerase RpiA [Thermoplasmata archaeon]
MDLKQVAGERAVEYVKDGMVVGLGTGSTVYFTIKRLGMMVAEGFEIIGIPTSIHTEKIAKESGIRLTTLEEHPEIDVTIDGADEVDPNLNLIKGMGGALLREKIVASATKMEVIVVDPSKMVDILGTKSPLPVEVASFGWKNCQNELKKLGCEAKLRLKEGAPYLSDNNNYIVDCSFEKIGNPENLESEINNIPGVMENGLFLGIADIVIIGTEDGGKLFSKPL